MVGLPCSGKTTAARKLEKQYNALVFTPDVWHLRLFGDDADSDDHDQKHDSVENIMWEHACRVLSLGVDVILDFGFWGKSEREHFRERAAKLGVGFKIHYMDVPEKELYKRLEKRNKSAMKNKNKPKDVFIISREKMDSYIKKFQPPSPDELM